MCCPGDRRAGSTQFPDCSYASLRFAFGTALVEQLNTLNSTIERASAKAKA